MAVAAPASAEVPVGNPKVNFYGNLYRSYLRRNKPLLWRESQNWGIFSGVDGKQWDPELLQMLLQEKRAPHQINFCQNQVNKLLGTALQNELQTDFVPAMGQPNDDTILLNGTMEADRNASNWGKTKRQLIRAGLVMRGTAEMYIDYQDDPRGIIGLRYINHNRIMYDPDWTTDNINDNKHIIQWAWMDPEEIKLVYNKKSEEIEQQIKIWRQAISTRMENSYSTENNGYSSYYDNPEFVDILGGRFLVIQVSRLEKVPTERLYDREKGEFLPDMSPENRTAMMQLRGSSLRVLRDKTAVVKVATVAPGLSQTLMLEDGNHPVQIGRYPLFTWSYLNINGEPQGVIDVLKDLQQMYNKRESMFTYWQTTVANGAEFVEENFFANDTQLSNYINNKNIPGKTFIVRDGTISQNRAGIGTRPRDNIPNDLHVSADRAFAMVPEVSPITPAITGAEGKSGESGVLRRQKRSEALTSLEHMKRSLMDLEQEIGDAYFLLFKQHYAGATRTRTNPDTGEIFEMNVPLANGAILNNIARMRRHKVRITQSKKGVSVREELLDRYIEAMPFFQNPILRSQIEKAALTVMPNIPDEEIQQGEMAANAFMNLQFSRVQLETAQNIAGIQQLDGQLAPAGAPGAPSGPPSPALPGEGGGLSVEGKVLKPGQGIPVDVRTINQLNK